jgi:hypothetical protein
VSEPTPNEPQFEHMEPRGEFTPNVCSACQRAIPDAYYEAAGRIFCAPCRDAAMASLGTGGAGARLVKAVLLGTGAAAVSAVVWYGIVKLTNLELGIIAIAVGFAVGAAVRIGSEQRGGWAYQAIAVLLTYLAIAASYVPVVMESFRSQAAAEIDERMLLAGSIAVALTLPVLQATAGTGIIGLLIVCFALYEAWRINKRRTIAFSGPFRLQQTARTPA